MQRTSQKGFSLLHVMPLVAIVTAVAVIGTLVFNKSHAYPNPSFACSVSFGPGSGSTMITFSYSYKNNSKYTSAPTNLRINLQGTTNGLYENTVVRNVWIGSLAPYHTGTWKGSLFYVAPHSNFTLFGTSLNNVGGTSTCNGSRTFVR